jgi:hypothetical protein
MTSAEGPRSILKTSIENSCRSLLSWFEEQDFCGHDPHDLLESPIVPGFIKSSSFARLAILQAGRRSPIDLHTLLRVPRRFNAKGGALILQGLLRATDKVNPAWRERTTDLKKRLVDAAVRTKHGVGWGYPFDWQSRTHFVPKNTPTIVTTSFVAEALLSLYELEPSDDLLLLLTQAADYIIKDVSRMNTPDGISFGYSEGDKQVVFNASLLGAAYLARLGAKLGEDEYLELARQAANFVVKQQASNGSWRYGLAESQQWSDSFHTGYVLLSLRQIAAALGSHEYDEAIARGYSHYRAVFFREDGLPRYFANVDHPIDTHAAAHAIITLNAFGDRPAAVHIAKWMCSNMQNADGSFMYQKHRRYTNRIAYIRWSNAWMFLALSTLISEEISV